MELIIAAFKTTSSLELVSVAFGLAYVILAARENIWCWPAALVGTGTAIFLFWDASLLMESGLNVYYVAMALFGWWQWRHGGKSKTSLDIQTWGYGQHGIALGIIVCLTLTSGFLLSKHTSAALPFVDSFTTWSAVIATWMVARKVIENWLYWIVIDAVSVWLFIQKDLYFYAALFVLYTIIAIYGYLNWQRILQNVKDTT